MQVTVIIISNYGREAIYPACPKSQTFAHIAGTKTLTRATLRHIKALGYTVNVEQPAVTI